MTPEQEQAQAKQHGNLFQKHDVIPTPEAEKVIAVEIVGDGSQEAGIMLDGEWHKKGSRCNISVKQYRALARLLLWIDGPAEHCPCADTLIHPDAKSAPSKTAP